MWKYDTLVVGKTKRKIFLALETWCYTQTLRINYTEYIIDKEVFGSVRGTRSFSKMLKTRITESIGHIIYHNNLLCRIIEGFIE